MPTPEGPAVFVADFDANRWDVAFPFAGQTIMVSLPLSPDQWSVLDRRNWQAVRERLPAGFSLIQALRRAILAEL